MNYTAGTKVKVVKGDPRFIGRVLTIKNDGFHFDDTNEVGYTVQENAFVFRHSELQKAS